MYDRVLVTGGNGLLGTKTIELLLAQGRHPISVSLEPEAMNMFLGEFPYRQLDITDEAAVSALLRDERPDAVIHTAAFTAVDACESQRDLCRRVNVDGSANVARGCRRIGARLAHISTEYVFDGEAGPYSEEDVPRPISHYGATKLESERAVAREWDDLVIARTTVLVGHAPNVRPGFIAWLVSKLGQGVRVSIVDDQVGSPTLADNLAQMVVALLDSGRHGVYNTVGGSVIDRFVFSTMAAELYGLDGGLIDRIKTRDLNQPAPRPLKAGLLMDKFHRDFPEVRVLDAREILETLGRQMGILR